MTGGDEADEGNTVVSGEMEEGNIQREIPRLKGQRLDDWLTSCCCAASRTRPDGEIRENGNMHLNNTAMLVLQQVSSSL